MEIGLLPTNKIQEFFHLKDCHYKLQVAMAVCEDDFLAMCKDNSCKEGGQKEADGSSLVEVASSSCISFDMWNGCTVKNFRAKLGQNKTFKPVLVYLLKQVTEYLSQINVHYLVCGGTALSVYREGGKFIHRDEDVDIAIFESDFSTVLQNLSSFTSMQDGNISMSDTCPVKGTSWFDNDGNEIPYNGCGGKRLKFAGTKKLWDKFGIRPDIRFDQTLAHLDVFTLGQHPDDPSCFCYNWNIPESYDFRKKRFPKTCVLPLKTYNFEGLNVQGPSDLKTFLEVEYGYLGRDAMFDFASQLYVKIPESVFEELPKHVKNVMANKLTK